MSTERETEQPRVITRAEMRADLDAMVSKANARQPAPAPSLPPAQPAPAAGDSPRDLYRSDKLPRQLANMRSVKACPYCGEKVKYLTKNAATVTFRCKTSITRYMADSRHLQSVSCCQREILALEADLAAARADRDSHQREAIRAMERESALRRALERLLAFSRHGLSLVEKKAAEDEAAAALTGSAGAGWRLLNPGEAIKEGDQLLRDDATTWEAFSKQAGNGLFIGQKWSPGFHVPFRTPAEPADWPSEAEVNAIHQAAWDEKQAYIARGVCSTCGACSAKEAEKKCTPRRDATDEYSCAGEELWKEPAAEGGGL